MNKDFAKGVLLTLAILSVLGTLTAIGFHTASEILGGTFPGSYIFSGKVEFEDELILANYSAKPSCILTNKGSLVFDDVNDKPFVCNGTNWKPLDSDFDSDGITDWLDADDENSSLLHINLTPENIKNGTIIFGVEGNLIEEGTNFFECWGEVHEDNSVPTTFYANSTLVNSAHMPGQNPIRPAQDWGCYFLSNPNSRIEKACLNMTAYGSLGSSCTGSGNTVSVRLFWKDGRVTTDASISPRYWWDCSTHNDEIRDWGAAVYCR